jgi:hypothetical protein
MADSGAPGPEPTVDAVNAPNWKDPREGQPFEEPGNVRLAVEAYQPRGISDATVRKRQYIEVDDEPWNSTSVSRITLDKSKIQTAEMSSIGFVAAEGALTTALSAAKSSADVTKALEKAEKDGARKGCPALGDADKLLKAFKKAEETEGEEEDKKTAMDAALKGRPKAPKKPGAQGSGWDDMKRAVGSVHSTAGGL